MIPVVMPTYSRADVLFERGEGTYLYATDGRRYLDFTAGIAVVAFGHANPYLVKALTEQAGKLWHTSNLYRVPGQEQLGERLAAHTFADTMFFTNSGAEAWECGAKLVRKYHYEKGNPKRTRIITFDHAFHGRTLASISAAQQEKLTKGFGPLLDGFDLVPFGDLDAVRRAITDETAGICLEPIQGEGGIRPATKEFMQGLRALCDEHGLLLFLDEIQCGMGRTGKLFAHEWYGITPDVMCVAKGIGGGFPLGACLATEEAASGMTAGTHGSTYGGNPLAMAVGNAVLDLMLAPGFLGEVQARVAYLDDKLAALVAAHPGTFTEVRGMGLLKGLKCVPVNGDVVNKARDLGLLLVGAGDNVVRIIPPLTVTESEIDEAIAILERVAVEGVA